MTKNITLKLEERILHRARFKAVGNRQSLSQWVADLITQQVSGEGEYDKARERALRQLARGFHLGGKPLSRDEIYAR